MMEKPLLSSSRLVDSVRAIENSRRRIAVVVDAEGRLQGTLTDGDVRRCLLAGGTLETGVTGAMNASPLSAPVDSTDLHLLELMHSRNVMAVPLVDLAGRFKRLVHLMDLTPGQDQGDASGFACAVIMAGGMGTRLRPLTEHIPKPMVDIGGVPLLERQIARLARSGMRQVYLAVNYLGHIIEDHFGDGDGFGLRISYLREQESLGTAGALSLLPERPDRPVLVMNGDILTLSDFGSLLAFHQRHGADLTVAAVDYHIRIPYGVIQAEGAYAVSLTEKPAQRFLCNAGMYVLGPRVFGHLPDRPAFNMPDIIAGALAGGRKVAVFPLHEYWSDVGTPADLEKAREFYLNHINDHE